MLTLVLDMAHHDAELLLLATWPRSLLVYCWLFVKVLVSES